jgi:pimeloyl-ACP methyl ester carboxylesterase
MTETTARAINGSIELAYERMGTGDGDPLLLIMGYGVQRHFWPDEFCAELVRRGFDPVRFDNRDSGESTHLSWLPKPPMSAIMMMPHVVAPYRLSDLAADAVAVMDAQGWRSAHVMGVSMGGMIAQTMAIEHPDRVRSLVSMSSTPSPWIGRPRPSFYLSLAARQGRTAEQVADRLVRQSRIIGSPAYPVDEAWVREYALTAFARGHDPAGTQRQLAAVMASGGRMRKLRRVTAPTLVMHGDADRLIRPVAARVTAAAVPRARLVTFPGMGHDLPPELFSSVAAEVQRVAALPSRRRRGAGMRPARAR